MEIISRLYFYFAYHRYHTTIYTQGSPLQVSDSITGFKNTPYYLDYDRKYQNNEEGFKSLPGDVSIPEKKENDFWVLLLGGSAMEGMGSNKDGEWLDITGISDHPATESIAYKLQLLLQAKLPQRKVKVFNAATSSYVLWQSMQKYIHLQKKMAVDWVISMDGYNEMSSIDENFNVNESINKDWQQRPIFKAPSKYIIPLTQHSFLINALKQFIYHTKYNVRMTKNKKANFPVRTKWLNKAPLPIKIIAKDSSIKRAVDFYMNTLNEFDSLLTQSHTKHLLVLQPFLFDKGYHLMDSTEKALYNYYTSDYNYSTGHRFLKELQELLQEKEKLDKDILVIKPGNIKTGLFVDYCHFTRSGIDSVSGIFASVILQSLQTQ